MLLAPWDSVYDVLGRNNIARCVINAHGEIEADIMPCHQSVFINVIDKRVGEANKLES